MYEEVAVPPPTRAVDEIPSDGGSGDGAAVAVEAAPVAGRLTSKPLVRVLAAVTVVAVVLGLGYLALRFAPKLAALASYGYFGIFALMIVSGGSVFFPVPGMASVLLAGALWNPLLVGVAAGLGNSIGEVTGYIAGRSGRTLINADERPFFQRADRFLRRYGFPALVVFAAIPNPVFDVVGIAAGCLGYSLKRFWLAVAIGNTIKYTAMALLAMLLKGPFLDLISGLL
jgi:uncharacterized membrane protein YdjX (TVP38/TMEM64 family)